MTKMKTLSVSGIFAKPAPRSNVSIFPWARAELPGPALAFVDADRIEAVFPWVVPAWCRTRREQDVNLPNGKKISDNQFCHAFCGMSVGFSGL